MHENLRLNGCGDMKNTLAWTIAITGIAAEIFLATLDWWFDVPHYVLHIGDNVHFTRK
jgi:hypothetical protein